MDYLSMQNCHMLVWRWWRGQSFCCGCDQTGRLL